MSTVVKDNFEILARSIHLGYSCNWYRQIRKTVFTLSSGVSPCKLRFLRDLSGKLCYRKPLDLDAFSEHLILSKSLKLWIDIFWLFFLFQALALSRGKKERFCLWGHLIQRNFTSSGGTEKWYLFARSNQITGQWAGVLGASSYSSMKDSPSLSFTWGMEKIFEKNWSVIWELTGFHLISQKHTYIL